MDGLETLIEIGRMNAEITRIMLTGYATMASAIEAVNAGIDGFLTKPFENEELRAKVREYNIKKRLKQFVSEQVLAEIQKNARTIPRSECSVTRPVQRHAGFLRPFRTTQPRWSSPNSSTATISLPSTTSSFPTTGRWTSISGTASWGSSGRRSAASDDAAAGRAGRPGRSVEEIAGINGNIPEAERRIAVGIGIATGEVMAGIFGSPRKKEYTVFGAPVNLASRLEKLARADQILICGETARLVENLVRMEKIPAPIIRGLARPPTCSASSGENRK